jgi:hypothetical protein
MCVYTIWSSLNFLYIFWLMFFIRFGKFWPLLLPTFLLPLSLTSFWDSRNTPTLVCLIVFSKPLFICLYLLWATLDNLNWPIYNFTNSSAYPNLLIRAVMGWVVSSNVQALTPQYLWMCLYLEVGLLQMSSIKMRLPHIRVDPNSITVENFSCLNRIIWTYRHRGKRAMRQQRQVLE